MKQIIIAAAIMFASFSTQAQSFTVVNNTCFPVDYSIQCFTSGTCTTTATSILYTVPAGRTQSYANMSAVTWTSSLSPTDVYGFINVDASNPPSCIIGAAVGDFASCSSTGTVSFSGPSCYACYMGVPTATWVNSSGNITVTIN